MFRYFIMHIKILIRMDNVNVEPILIISASVVVWRTLLKVNLILPAGQRLELESGLV